MLGPPIRVHVVVDSLTWGGAEMLLGDLAAGAPHAGIELSVGYLSERDGSPAAGRLRARGIEPMLAPATGLIKLSAFAAVRRQVRAVVRCTSVTRSCWGRGRQPTRRAHRLDDPPKTEWEDELGDRVKLRLIALARRRRAARVIAVSEAARRVFLEYGWDRADRVVVAHNGVNARQKPAAPRRVRADLGPGPEDLVVSMLSVPRLGKGHDVAAATVAKLAGRHPYARLLALGDGPARAAIERQPEPLGERAVFTGHRDDVRRVLDAADFVLHPSRVGAFPTALLEATASGVPVVASAKGGLPAIVDDGRTGC